MPGLYSRRQLLLGAGGGLLAGGAIAEGTHALVGAQTVPTDVIPPGESFMNEHGVLKRVLLVYSAAIGRADTDPELAANALHSGAVIIHDFIENFHEALEESFVFPALKEAHTLVSTVDTLLVQHARGRLITELVLASATTDTLATTTGRSRIINAIQAFIRMYEPHEAREDTVVFPAYRALLTAEQLVAVGDDILAAQRQLFGSDGFAATVSHVARIEQSLGIYNLAQFTPADDAAFIP
jgi:hemerythrin-like domain-containing protein